MKFLGLAAVAVVALVGTGGLEVHGQTEQGLLRGVTELDPFVLPLDSDSETCGIKDGNVRELLVEAMADAPFDVGGRDHVLFVRLSSLPKQGECFSSIDLGVYWEGRVALPGNPDGIRARVKLWEKGTILISSRSQHWNEVSGILKYLVANLKSAWQADNNGSG